jgi:hypothetical protein
MSRCKKLSYLVAVIRPMWITLKFWASKLFSHDGEIYVTVNINKFIILLDRAFRFNQMSKKSWLQSNRVQRFSYMLIDEISIAVSKTTVPKFPLNLDRKTGIDPIVRIKLYVARIFRIHLKKPELIKISHIEILTHLIEKEKLVLLREKHITRIAYELLEDFQK